MRFIKILKKAKSGSESAILHLLDMFRPLLLSYSKVNNKFDEDLWS